MLLVALERVSGPEPDLPARARPGGRDLEGPLRRSDGARQDDVEAPDGRRSLDRLSADLAAEAQGPDHVTEEVHPLLPPLHERDLEVGARDGDRDPRKPGTRAEIHDPGSRRDCRYGGQGLLCVHPQILEGGRAHEVHSGPPASHLLEEALDLFLRGFRKLQVRPERFSHA